MVNVADIPDGTIVRGRLLRYGEKGGEIDVPDYEAEGVGPIVEGPLKTLPSIWGSTSCFVGKWAVEEDSIEVVEHDE